MAFQVGNASLIYHVSACGKLYSIGCYIDVCYIAKPEGKPELQLIWRSLRWYYGIYHAI